MRQVLEEKTNVLTRCSMTELPKSGDQRTLCLHTPVPLLVPRERRKQCEIDGYIIPVRTKVMVNASAIGRDPKTWVDAERFEDG